MGTEYPFPAGLAALTTLFCDRIMKIKTGSRVVITGNSRQKGILLDHWQGTHAIIRLDHPLRKRSGDQFSIVLVHLDNVFAL